jgi:hypothetical protein
MERRDSVIYTSKIKQPEMGGFDERRKAVWWGYARRLDNKSRMKGDFHVRFCEKLKVKFLGLTRLICTY